MNSPGYCEMANRFGKKKEFIEFIGEGIREPMADISPPNVKSWKLSEHFKCPIANIHGMDYNFDELGSDEYGTIFCFEILEHLQNPLLFLSNVKKILNNRGVLYLSTPARPRFLWPGFHYNEIEPGRLEKWLLNPLGLKVVKKRFIKHKYRFTWRYFTGIRPMLRLLLIGRQGTYIYKIVKKGNNLNIKRLYIFGLRHGGTTAIASALGAHSDINMLCESTTNDVSKLIGKKYQANKIVVGFYISLDKKSTNTRNFIHLKLGRLFKLVNKRYMFKGQCMYSVRDLMKEDCKIIVIKREKEPHIKSILVGTHYNRKEALKDYDLSINILDHIIFESRDCYVVQYKNFTKEPEKTLKSICEYLDIQYEKKMLSGCRYNDFYTADKIWQNE